VKSARLKWSTNQSVQILGWGIRFFLAATLSSAQLPGGLAPFSLGCVSAAGTGGDGIAALCGALCGTLLFQEFRTGLAQIAAAILIFAASTALRGLKLSERPAFLPAVAAGMFLAVKGVYLLQSLSPEQEILSCLLSALLVGISAWAYQPMLTPGREKLEPKSVLFLAVTVLAGLWDVAPGGVSLGRIGVSCLVLYTAWDQGPALGMEAGLGAGILMDLCVGEGRLLYAAVYGVAGLAAGLRQGRGRVRSALLWLCAAAVLLLIAAENAAPLYEELVAAGIFLLLPRHLLGGKRVRQPEPEMEDTMLTRLKTQLTQTASAFRELYDSLGRAASPAPEENPAIIFDRAAEKTCRGCALCDLCWQKEYNSTFNAFNDATPYLLERGRAMPKDFPQHFTGRCIHLPELLGAVNEELTAFLLRRQYRRQLEETRKSARGQYAQMSDLLSATAAGLGEARMAFGEGHACRIGAAMRPKEGEVVCGDTVTSFETKQGMLCLALSDGMGSGEPARKESALTIRLLQQFLQAGIEPEAALKTLNAAWNLRSADTGSFTTVDLLTVQPDGIAATIYKYGAAPSYWKKNGSVRRITGRALPAGLRLAPGVPDVTRMTLEPGGFLVMVSDGVADALRDDWLQNLLAGYTGGDPQELAGLILSEILRQGPLGDDCCAQVLYLPPEENSLPQSV